MTNKHVMIKTYRELQLTKGGEKGGGKKCRVGGGEKFHQRKMRFKNEINFWGG